VPERTSLTPRDAERRRALIRMKAVAAGLVRMFLTAALMGISVPLFALAALPVGEGTDPTVFPTSGMYRLLSDFYPKHGTPQLIESTVVVSGGPIAAGTKLIPDLAPKRSANLEASLTMEPTPPIAGLKTLLFFNLNPDAGLERYLGAWGHMLAVSEDLVDMIHNHPFLGDGGPHVQFNLIFPRPVAYRLWVQFQRQGIVNTVRFDVPVSRLG